MALPRSTGLDRYTLALSSVGFWKGIGIGPGTCWCIKFIVMCDKVKFRGLFFVVFLAAYQPVGCFNSLFGELSGF